ncbi:MAG: hypothetical protein DMD91_10630 [Candidatus Rokuibacteriota bacterium]|nr:MAG: hypothetical protein DMD91_10630 [Candidatus Rokubacteria bacterium]
MTAFAPACETSLDLALTGRGLAADLCSSQDQRRSFKIQRLNPPGIHSSKNLSSLTPSLPLGLAYVAAALERTGFSVGVIDAIGEAPSRVEKEGVFRRVGLGTADIIRWIDADTRVLALSVMFSFLWPSTRKLIHGIRAARPDLVIVGGGEHFTGLTEASMEQAPLDFIVMGEGEETAVVLMDALAAGLTDYERVSGVAWRDGGRIRVNARRSRHRDVDDLPWPAWHLFDVRAYDERGLVNGIHKGLTIPILATRGCPYQCTYCSSPSMWTQRWLPRDPVDVAEEIEHYVRTYGAANFPFAIIRKDWTVAFCRELIRRKLEVVWQFPSGTRCEAIESVNLRLRAENNFCEHLSASAFTFAKYWVFLNFYLASLLARRSPLMRVLSSLWTSREDSKLEALVQEIKRRFKVSLRLAQTP